MPVEQIAGQYQASPQTFGDGQTILVQVDEQGNIKTTGSGTAGTPSSGVQSVQGIDGMRPVDTYAIDPNTELPIDPSVPAEVTPGAVDDAWTYAAAASGIVNTTTAVTIKAAAGSGVRNYITAFQISSEALGTATEFAIRDGAGGTVLWRTKIGTGGLTGGREFVLPTPLAGTANTLLEVVTLTASGTGAVYFNAQGFAR